MTTKGVSTNNYDYKTEPQTHGLTFRSKVSPDTIGELEHEKHMIAEGRARYLKRKSNKTQWSDEGKPRGLIDDAVVVVAEAIQKRYDDEIKTEGRPYAWMKVWEDLLSLPRGAELMALGGLSVLMDGVARNASLNNSLVTLGKTLELELWSARLREFDKRLHKRIEDKVRRDHVSLRYRIKAAKAIAGAEGFTTKSMRPSDLVKIGAPLLSVILETTDLFECWDYFDKNGKTVRRVGLTEQAGEAIAESEYAESWMEPMWQPMIVPPRDWEDMNTGAYLDPSLSLQLKLVRGANSQQHKLIHDQVRTGGLKDILDSVNLIQKTPYKINQYILAAVTWAWKSGVDVKKFPQRDEIELPARPDDWDDWTPEQRKGWVIDRRDVVMRNREIDGGRVIMQQDLQTAYFLSDYDQFYCPHNLDFRGRVYPVPSFNYHRDSHIKAMFLFARGKPIGEEGFKFLALKVADLGDFDRISKKPLQERLNWVIDNEDMIIACGTNFEDSFDYWMAADKPFEFLAACHEYVQVVKHGFDYPCGLPIGLDGSNSAAQHYAAASRARDEGKMVNLTAEDEPQDVYQVVADAVNEKLRADTDKPDMAKLWLDYGVTRKIVKRMTMTFGYGSNQYGFATQIRDDEMKPLTNDVQRGRIPEHPFGSDKGHQAAVYLAKATWECVNEIIFEGARGMQYFKDLADLCSSEHKLMQWQTPLGFPVVHRYKTLVAKKIKLYLHDRETGVRKRTQVTVLEKRDHLDSTPDKRKNRSSVSPNVIHSMDACHLQMTVLNAVDNHRIRDFFLIHDSFGVMPADCPAMFNAVRESFVELYSNTCLYTMLRNQVEDYLEHPDKAEFPEIPPKGDLDLTEVKRSLYCFL